MVRKLSISYIVAAELGTVLGMALASYTVRGHAPDKYFWFIAAIFYFAVNVWLFRTRRLSKSTRQSE
jgi:hypothetical protein